MKGLRTLGAALAMAQCLSALPPSLDHVVLLDVSGSMRQKSYSTPQSWGPEVPALLTSLLQAEGEFFGPDSRFILRPFSDTETDQRERRIALGPAHLSEFPERFSEVDPPLNGATDMSRALDLGQLMLQACPHPGVIWLITDNENNFATNQSDHKFYERLRDSTDYNYVYLFPLADPQNHPNDSLVMYLLIPPRVMSREEAHALAEQVEKRTKFGGMLFRPLYTETDATPLEFSKELNLEAPGKHRIEQEGGQTVLYFREGEKLQGNLNFRIRSRLKGWKLEGATLEDAEVELRVPSTYVDGSSEKLRWQVTPKALDVAPEQDSLTLFHLQIAGPGGKPIRLQRRPGDMLTHLFSKYLPEIEGNVKMKATLRVDQGNLKHEVTPEMQQRLQAVPRLAEIEQYMLQQQDMSQNQGNERDIQFQRKLIIRVKADPTSAIVAVALLGLAGLASAVVAGAFLLWKVPLQLEGPGVDEEFSLSALWGQYLVCSGKGEPFCRLYCKLGSLQLRSEVDCLFEDDQRQLAVQWQGDEFRFEVGQEGKSREVFWLRRRHTGSGPTGGGEGPL